MKKTQTKKVDKKDISLAYDHNVDNHFRAHMNLGKDVVVAEEVVIDVKSLDHDFLMYDDVLDRFYEIMDVKYPESSFPNACISSIEILPKNEDVWVPVFRESDTEAIDECIKSKKHSKFLVLPEATYTLTPECRLWMKMKELGIIAENASFSYDDMHSLVELSKGNTAE